MGIYIKDIEMPDGCGDCPFCSCVASDKGRAEFQCDIFFVYSAEVIYVTDIIAKGEIPSFCPLVEVPDKQWIPVTERLPEAGTRCLVTRFDYVTKTPFIDLLWFEGGEWWNRRFCGDFAVTHWMPLPEPPKEEI